MKEKEQHIKKGKYEKNILFYLVHNFSHSSSLTFGDTFHSSLLLQIPDIPIIKGKASINP